MRRLCAFLGALALLAASVPVSAIDWVEETPVKDSCCAGDPGPATAQDTRPNSEPLDEDCCPARCHDCFLPCCHGLVSLAAASVTIGTDVFSQRSPSTEDEQGSFFAPRAVDHPPRR